MITKEQIRASLFGFAVADALGVPVEFSTRSARQLKPVTGMMGYGTFYKPIGTWSDDTSMTLATMDSMKHGLDFEDIMRRFLAWANDAKYTAGDETFDIGVATNIALSRFQHGTPALDCGGTDEHSNGNGSLMRILPGVFFAARHMPDAPLGEKLEIIHKLSALTHAHEMSQIACGIYACVAWRLLEDGSRESIFRGLDDARGFYENWADFPRFERIFREDFAQLPMDEIISSGFVVTTLEAALWCLLNAVTFADCALTAVNLGQDTDTIAAIACGLAGLLFGYNGIPTEWLDVLLRKDLIEAMCWD